MKEITDLGMVDYIHQFTPGCLLDKDLVISEISGHAEGKNMDFSSIRLNAYSTFLVIEGEMTIEMDCREFHLTSGTVLEMGTDCLVENIVFSPGMRGYHWMMAHDLMKEVINPLIPLFPGNMLKLKYMHPSQTLDRQTLETLQTTIRQIQSYVVDAEHYYRRPIVKNLLGILLMELNDSLWKKYGSESEEVGNFGTVKEQFRQLLVQYCKTEHEVTFYADKLCITPDHLSKVMREYSGRSASKWINHALITESKVLLRKPDLTIQRIAEILYFSDQSTFGKYFKKHTGMSPIAYRKIK